MQRVFHIFGGLSGALQRGAFGQLQVDEGVALVFGGEKPSRQPCAEQDDEDADAGDDQNADERLADKPA
jgi:hypothetical protein